MPDKKIDAFSGVSTTGHEWDGIRELENPMPRWWLWSFYACIVWAIGYMIAYPAWPLISSATSGLLGYSSRQELAVSLDKVAADQAGLRAAIAAKPLPAIMADETLRRFAISAGAAAFKVNCIQCHGSGAQGSGAQGSGGYPNLNDDDWLWGGDIETIHQTIAHGVRFAGDPETRASEMPPFGDILKPQQIREVAAYVASLTTAPSDPKLAAAGRQIFADNCAACHGQQATGDKSLGAPNLADAIWLYGASEDSIAAQIAKPQHGVMPAWSARLGDTAVKELAVYVHSLGGGK